MKNYSITFSVLGAGLGLLLSVKYSMEGNNEAALGWGVSAIWALTSMFATLNQNK